MQSYDLASDALRMRTFHDLSTDDFASKSLVSRADITRLEAGHPGILKQTVECVFACSYRMGLNLNQEKASFLIDDKKDSVALFHGAKGDIVGDIDARHSSISNDFGSGFYLGETLPQAATWVAGVSESSVYCFYFKPEPDMKELVFPVSREWMYAILYYRHAFHRKKVPEEVANIVKRVEEVDYIIAPIADNKMYEILNQFIRGNITDEACLHALSMTDLGNQYVLKSDKAIHSLEFRDRFYLCEPEKRDYLMQKEKDALDAVNKVKMSLIEYRRKGAFIDELF